MIDYNNSKIYMLSNGKYVYIGGTTMTIARRNALKVGTLKNIRLLDIMASGIKIKTQIIEYFSCQTKRELRKRIRECKREYKLNKKVEENVVSFLTFSFTD